MFYENQFQLNQTQSKWNNNKGVKVGKIFLHLTHAKKRCLCYIYTLDIYFGRIITYTRVQTL